MLDITTTPASSPASQDSQNNQGMFYLCFAFVLLIALVAQAVFVKWRPWFPGAESEKSLFKGVKVAVHTFMSQLT